MHEKQKHVCLKILELSDHMGRYKYHWEKKTQKKKNIFLGRQAEYGKKKLIILQKIQRKKRNTSTFLSLECQGI